MTNEAPKGLRQNLLRSYMSDPISDPEFFESCPAWREWQTLLFGLCFFHAVVQERRLFGPLGWNIPYEFNESDLRISIMQLQMFLKDYKEVPFDALTYLTGECNYGGRVTDDKDRRLLMSLLVIYYNPATVYESQHPFSPSGMYYVPRFADHKNIIDYIVSLPLTAQPEVFGLHENASITKENKETNTLLTGVLLTQPHIGQGGGSKDSEAQTIELAHDILLRLPDEFNIYEVSQQYPVMYTNSMNTVLRQELIRFNRLLVAVQTSLKDMVKACRGQVVMNESLEDVYVSLNVGRVPKAWMGKSYPSLKPLGSYVSDLIARLHTFQTWIEEGPPIVFWLSGFYFTQSFLTGVLQNYSRKHHLSIDLLHFEFTITILEKEEQVRSEPEFGVYVRVCNIIFIDDIYFI